MPKYKKIVRAVDTAARAKKAGVTITHAAEAGALCAIIDYLRWPDDKWSIQPPQTQNRSHLSCDLRFDAGHGVNLLMPFAAHVKATGSTEVAVVVGVTRFDVNMSKSEAVAEFCKHVSVRIFDRAKEMAGE